MKLVSGTCTASDIERWRQTGYSGPFWQSCGCLMKGTLYWGESVGFSGRCLVYSVYLDEKRHIDGYDWSLWRWLRPPQDGQGSAGSASMLVMSPRAPILQIAQNYSFKLKVQSELKIQPINTLISVQTHNRKKRLAPSLPLSCMTIFLSNPGLDNQSSVWYSG